MNIPRFNTNRAVNTGRETDNERGSKITFWSQPRPVLSFGNSLIFKTLRHLENDRQEPITTKAEMADFRVTAEQEGGTKLTCIRRQNRCRTREFPRERAALGLSRTQSAPQPASENRHCQAPPPAVWLKKGRAEDIGLTSTLAEATRWTTAFMALISVLRRPRAARRLRLELTRRKTGTGGRQDSECIFYQQLPDRSRSRDADVDSKWASGPWLWWAHLLIIGISRLVYETVSRVIAYVAGSNNACVKSTLRGINMIILIEKYSLKKTLWAYTAFQDKSLESDSRTERLGLDSFWALPVFSIGISTMCLLVSRFCRRRNVDDRNHADYPDEEYETIHSMRIRVRRWMNFTAMEDDSWAALLINEVTYVCFKDLLFHRQVT